jgi:hypothetical protein
MAVRRPGSYEGCPNHDPVDGYQAIMNRGPATT